MFEKNTPRDFFIHIGAFATLYFAAIALITLLFQVINYTFPDELTGYYGYYDPYSGPLRFAVASLIVLTPIFIFLLRGIQRESRENPERQKMGVRKWLTYITLFIAGVTIIGDLIVLLNTFLGGTLATPFLLKVVALFLVMGAGFGYFFLDIRGYWAKNPAYSRYAGWGTIAIVAISIIGAFVIMGSPKEQRDIRLDIEQIQHLGMVQAQIIQYWQQNERLPENIAALESDITGFYVPEAPDGRTPYTYEKTGDLSFELCATFAKESLSAESYAIDYYGVEGGSNWEHGVGATCFERTIDPNIIQPFPKALVPTR